MDEETRIHVESPAPAEPAPADSEGQGTDRDGSSSRVVHGPGRGRQVAAVVVLVALVAAGLGVMAGGGSEPDGRDDTDADADDAEQPADPRPARVVWAEATSRLGQSRSFAYRGSVHAPGPDGPARPGAWLAEDVTVEGAVLLPPSITREVAVDGSGRAAETVTSASTAWSRTAETVDGLAAATWEVVRPPETWSAEPDSRLGIALIADVLRAARDRRRDPPHGSGGRTLRATVPTEGRLQPRVEMFAGAEVSIDLDATGDVTRVAVTAGPAAEPRLAVDLDLDRLGDPGLVTPADVGEPARRTFAAAAPEVADVEALELSQVPAGWALTQAYEWPGGIARPPEQPPVQVPACSGLTLEYRDLRTVLQGLLTLTVMQPSCDEPTRAHESGEPFRAGSFAGRVEEGIPQTYGVVSDGTTTVTFDTDLSAADVAVVLASLAPLDPAREPASIADLSPP